MNTEKLKNWLRYEIQLAETLQSKHSGCSDDMRERETWAAFCGRKYALMSVLRRVEEMEE